MSHPPPTEHGSAALDLAHYFSPATHWDSPWYLTQDLPPPIANNRPPSFSSAWEMRGPSKTVFGGAIFADLSMCWYSVQFPTTAKSDPNDSRTVHRKAQYFPCPAARDQATLVEAHETYGETIAAFAESFEGTGQYCARGECWDLASEALKYFDQYDYVPKPIPSLSRTHGHLIYEGKAVKNGLQQCGRWRGGDDRIRRGDIAEWRSVRIGMGKTGGYAILGAPDHTAVIVSDCVPSTHVYDGGPVKPSQLGLLEVIEQSVGSPPKRQTYDLNQFQEGEMWIYRPIGMLDYVGSLLEPRCPENVGALSI
ncbi:hypothetical protein PHLCEN_2v11102 [Hermanssonia centrifuga]|uniref:BBC1/AIM3 cysteine proteinase-fold domain-containing protein n=1 Tax=Hermanssonia centrifuga TaxID=98765 RepID=A0A2R6NL67_9APHY|nr:hypothetical protein PHLCEN_2v11102 [Hermanssonia centrifuga]